MARQGPRRFLSAQLPTLGILAGLQVFPDNATGTPASTVTMMSPEQGRALELFPHGDYDTEVVWHGREASWATGRITHLRSVTDPRSRRVVDLAVVQWDADAPALVLIVDRLGTIRVGDDVLPADATSPARWPPAYFETAQPLRRASRMGRMFEARTASRLLRIGIAKDGLRFEMHARRSLGHVSLPGWKKYLELWMRARPRTPRATQQPGRGDQ